MAATPKAAPTSAGVPLTGQKVATGARAAEPGSPSGGGAADANGRVKTCERCGKKWQGNSDVMLCLQCRTSSNRQQPLQRGGTGNGTGGVDAAAGDAGGAADRLAAGGKGANDPMAGRLVRKSTLENMARNVRNRVDTVSNEKLAPQRFMIRVEVPLSEISSTTQVMHERIARQLSRAVFDSSFGLPQRPGHDEKAFAETRAHAMLAKKRVDLQSLEAKVARLRMSIGRGHEGPTRTRSTNLNHYLEARSAERVDAALVSARRARSSKDRQTKNADWKLTAQMMVEQLKGERPVSERLGNGPLLTEGFPMEQDIARTLVPQGWTPYVEPIKDEGFMAQLGKSYASVVATGKKTPFNVCTRLNDVTPSNGPDPRCLLMKNCLEFLKDFFEPKATPERKATPDYFAFHKDWNEGKIGALLAASKQLLETQYHRLVEPRDHFDEPLDHFDAPRDHFDTKTICSFLEQEQIEATWENFWVLDEGRVPIWAVIFVCLRSGSYASLNTVIKEAAANQCLDALGRFPDWIRMHVEKGCIDHRSQLAVSAKLRELQDSRDPFQRFCHHYLLPFSPEEDIYYELLPSTQDFMWYKLMRILTAFSASSTHPGQVAPETLEDLQDIVLEGGAAHFSQNGQNPFLYFQVLVLTLQIDQAIQYVRSLPGFEVGAAHIALIFFHYGITSAADPDKPAPLLTGADLRAGDLSPVEGTLLGYLRSLVGAGRADDAIFYFNEIKDKRICARAIASMLTAASGDLLVKTLEAVNSPAFLTAISHGSEVVLVESELETIVELAAASHEINHRVIDSTRLRNRSKKPEARLRVWESLSRHFGVHLDPMIAQSNSKEREDLADFAKEIYDDDLQSARAKELVERKLPRDAVISAWLTFELTLNLVLFFDLVQTHDAFTALELLTQLELLPLRVDERVDITEYVHGKVITFRTMHECVRNNLGRILVGAMRMLSLIHTHLGSDLGDAASLHQHRVVLSQARQLMAFSGLYTPQFEIGDDDREFIIAAWGSISQ